MKNVHLLKVYPLPPPDVIIILATQAAQAYTPGLPRPSYCVVSGLFRQLGLSHSSRPLRLHSSQIYTRPVYRNGIPVYCNGQKFQLKELKSELNYFHRR